MSDGAGDASAAAGPSGELTRTSSLGRRFAIAALALLAIAAIIFTTLLHETESLAGDEHAVHTAQRSLLAAGLAERLVLDLETGLRGYILTGRAEFLQPWEEARQQLPTVLGELRHSVNREPQRGRAARISSGIDSYLYGYTTPLIHLAAHDRPAAATTVATAEGKHRVDLLRSRFSYFDAAETASLARADHDTRSATNAARVVAILGFLAIVAALFAGAFVARRSVLAPIGELASAARRIARGDLRIRTREDGPAEVAALQRSFNRMVSELESGQRQLSTELSEMTASGEQNLAILNAVFAQTPVGLALYDGELRFVRVNDALARIDGVPVEAHVGRTVDELVPNFDAQVPRLLRSVLATGEPALDVELSGETSASPGALRWWRASFFPMLQSEGRPIGVGQVMSEITEQKRSEEERARLRDRERRAVRRSALLQEASAALAGAFTLDQCLDTTVTYARAASGAGDVAILLADPLTEELALVRGERNGSNGSLRTSVARLLAHGGAALRRSRDAVADGERSRESTVDGWLVVPLGASPAPAGALALKDAVGLTDDDRAVVTALGQQCGQAIERAQLFEREHDIAVTLQRGLLPDALPARCGVDFAAVYRAAGRGLEVGGDFYDVWEAPDACLVLIGDVCGKGERAAAMTAMTRHTARAESRHTTDPAAILAALNEAVLAGSQADLVTAQCARISEAGATLAVSIASAGHPYPLVRRDGGSVEIVELAGPMLGLERDARFTVSEITLAAGDVLLQYTDGLTEAHAPEQLLSAAELAALVAAAPAAPERLLTALLAMIDARSDDPARDDIAIVAAGAEIR